MNKDDSSYIKAKHCIENHALDAGKAWALLAVAEAIYELVDLGLTQGTGLNNNGGLGL